MKMHFKVVLISAFCLLTQAAEDQWSRQITKVDGKQESNAAVDWVPVKSLPDSTKERVGAARVLSYHGSFAPNVAANEHFKRQVLPPQQSHNGQQQQQFSFPYQFQRFGFSPLPQQLNGPQKANLQQQPPTSQSFFKFEMPTYNHDGTRQEGTPNIQTGYQIHHTFGAGPVQQASFNAPLYSQKPTFPPEFHPIQLQQQQSPIHQQSQQLLHHRKPIQQNFIEEPKQPLRESKPLPTQEPNSFAAPLIQQPFAPPTHYQQLGKPASFQSQIPFAAPVRQQQDEEVQLVYVPFDTLYNQHQQQQQQQQQQHQQQQQQPQAYDNNKYNLVQHQVNPYQINDFYTEEPLPPNRNPNLYTTTTTTTLRPSTTTTTLRPSTYNDFLNFRYTTEKPKPKPKAHQPPLAMFLERNSNRVSRQDVVHALSSAKTIAVIDSPTHSAPHVFIGPAGMPAPSGYKKFELPYLSSIDNNNLGDGLKEIPFFVAPLSYRAPQGFNKILLPEPHVGSIVINKQQENYENTRGTTRRPQRPNKNMYITPIQDEVSRFQSTTQRVVPTTTHRLKVSSAKDFYPELIKEITSPRLEPAREQYEYTTLRQPSPTPTNYRWPTVSEENNLTPSTEYYQQEAIHEVTSPKIQKLERGKTHYQKRPEPAFTQSVRPYSQFKPMPNNIVNEEYYKVQPIKTTSSTTSTTSTSTSTSTTPSTTPETYFTEPFATSPQIEIQSNRGHVYRDQKPEVQHRFTTRPTISTISDEEQRMKTYFRQQEAHRNRPYVTSTTQGPIFENVQYTPVSVDYDREVQIPSTTPNYYGSSTVRTTTPKQRYTFYHPNPTTTNYEEQANTVPPKEDVVYFSRQPENQSEEPVQTTTTSERPQPTYPIRIPNNHRTVYANEIKTTDEKSSESEFDHYPYQHPSELPPLTPNLPGLVNALIEKERLEKSTTEIDVGTTTSTTRPTRRPIQRVRKPMVSKVSSSVSYSSSDSTSRRTLPRRRPYTPRNYTTSSTTPSTASASGSSSVTRASIIRNPNRIRYNPTPEERQSFRIKQRKPSSDKRKNNNNNSEDLEYQRDVLKQNYPVFKPTQQTTTIKPEESQEIYTVTPSNVQGFPELIEPMQIAQQFQEYSKDNYGPGYFPNEEDMSPTEPITKNEVSPVYTTTTTTEDTPETTKRPSFIRRGNRPVYPRPVTTTDATTAGTTTPNEEKYTVRPRNPPRKVIKIRSRTRRPHPASTSTTTTESEPTTKENTYQKLNRFNQDFYKEEDEQKKAPKRIRTKSKFHLDVQESKWSPSASGNSNFQPLGEKKNEKNLMKFDNEPQIVTAAPDSGDQTSKKDTYLLSVSAAYGPSDDEKPQPTAEPRISKKTEKSFTELLEEVMSDIEKTKIDKDNEKVNENENEKVPDQEVFESQRTEVARVQPHRRGVWRKVRVHPKETFDTAESQNIGSSILNSIFTSNQGRSTDFPIASNLEVVSSTEQENIIMTTPKSVSEQVSTMLPSELTATEPNLISMDESKIIRPGTDSLESFQETVTTSNYQNEDRNSHDSITRRIDDIDMDMDMENSASNDQDNQPSLFAEVKQQLSDLFAAEAEDDFEDGIKPNYSPRKQEYTSIQRVKTMTTENPLENVEFETEEQPANYETTTVAPTSRQTFHKKLMDSVVYATSTSTKVTHETEICYRGRCIKSAKQS